jgi:hypothetical protein
LLRPRKSKRSSGGANANLSQIRQTLSTLLGEIQKLLKLALARFSRPSAGKFGLNF